MTAAQTALPITQATATGIYFVARRRQSAIGESIYGSVDGITGAVSAMEKLPERQPADHRMGFALQANALTVTTAAPRPAFFI